MFNIIKLNEKDNIGIAPMDIPENKELSSDLKSREYIPYGHKVSLEKISKGEFIYRYGQIIGVSSKNIMPGEHVHSHNLSFSDFKREYEINIKNNTSKYLNKEFFFDGYKRDNGSSGTRNYIGLISTVNCSATVVKKISDRINNFLKGIMDHQVLGII